MRDRGFIDAVTSEDLSEHFNKPVRVYAGFDPTADSLHVGNLVAIMGLAWCQRFGHTPLVVLGGATAMVGDPSGKSHERSLLSEEEIAKNIEGLKKNFAQVLDFDHPSAKPLLLNNYDWFKDFSFLDVLRDVGKHFRVGPMMAKESVRARLNSDEGMSFTEFTYQLLQGYDFMHLSDHYGVTVQLGGSDQWGNITAGTELTRKLRAKSVYGMTFPLLTTSDGKKFGKSEKGAIYLSPERVSPYEFYQYFIRSADADVIHLMSILTFMDMKEIRRYESWMKGDLEEVYPVNAAQTRLAEEITRIVHGEDGLEKARAVTAGIKPGSQTNLDAKTLHAISADMPNASLMFDQVLDQKYIDLLVLSGLLKSKGEARRLVRNSGAYLNNKVVDDENLIVTRESLIDGNLLLLGSGKKRKMIVSLK